MKRIDTLVVFSFKIYRMVTSAPHTQLGADFLEVFAILLLCSDKIYCIPCSSNSSLIFANENPEVWQ